MSDGHKRRDYAMGLARMAWADMKAPGPGAVAVAIAAYPGWTVVVPGVME